MVVTGLCLVWCGSLHLCSSASGAPPESVGSTYATNCHMPILVYIGTVARSSTTSDVFNAVAEVHRREILDTLITGEKAVGAIVDDVSMSQPQVSKHLRVLSEVGLVTCRAEGRRRLYRLEPARLQPFQDWLAKYEQAWNDRLDRMDDYLTQLQEGEPQ
jgi:DNA-binding transcriptional ArsR family regulator